jgi:hypothetical protein
MDRLRRLILQRNCGGTTGLFIRYYVKLSSGTTPSSKEVEDCQQDDRSKQCDQHGRNGKGVVDSPYVKDGAQEVASQECACNGYNNIDHQVRAIVHDLSSDPTDYGRNDKVY